MTEQQGFKMPFSLYGMQLVSNAALTKTLPPELTWIDKVLLWNPCNHWSKKGRVIPSTEVFQYGNKLVANPETIGLLKREFGA